MPESASLSLCLAEQLVAEHGTAEAKKRLERADTRPGRDVGVRLMSGTYALCESVP
jgi:hypothetical protein